MANEKTELTLEGVANSLVERQAELGEDEVCVSLYHPSGERYVNTLAVEVKGLLVEGLREAGVEGSESTSYDAVVDGVLEVLANVDEYGQGIGLFFSFSKNDLAKGKLEALTPSEIEYVAFASEPYEQIFVGEVYEVMQLLWLHQVQATALVVHLSEQAAGFYEVVNKSMRKLGEEDNPYISDFMTDYLQEFTPDMGENIYHGTGQKELDQRLKAGNEQFMKDLTEVVEEQLSKRAVNYVIVFHSSKFSGLVEKWVSDDLDDKLDASILLREETHPTEEGLLLGVFEWLKKEYKERGKRAAREWREASVRPFVTGWKEVVDAAREGKVEALFLNPEAEVSGYLLEEKHLFTYAVKNSEEVEALVPYLSVAAAEAGVTPYFIEEIEQVVGGEVAAGLRYGE